MEIHNHKYTHLQCVFVVVRHSRSTMRPKHAALLPVQQEHPNEDDDGDQCTGVVGSVSGTTAAENSEKFDASFSSSGL